ncbi:MAG: pyruvate ferredoxin oxidoreductase [Firmicutes bacterium]|nr:pyruvate ferredoxin oxidoreductase [Bacillota bacterium]
MKLKDAMLLTGNHAAAYGAMLAQPKVMPIYPITPQTPVAEKLTEFQLQGLLDAEFITPESEHSAMAACISASLTGVRVFTATSSQGLMLMHELLHFASGARTPIVMVNANRTVASPWGFWADHTDSLSQRDTGWLQYYVENPQEALDTVLQAYKTAENPSVLLPAMISYEAFYVSHSLEVVEIPSQEAVDSYLPPFDPELRFDPEQGRSFGNVVSQELYYRHRKQLSQAMDKVFAIAKDADEKWKELTGRTYGLVERYKCENAQHIIIAMGTISGTARAAVDKMQSDGIPVGLMKIRLFRPFPVDKLRQELAGRDKVIILDRGSSPGTGGGSVLHQEVKSSLYGLKNAPEVYGYLAGVGGTNITPEKIEDLVKRSLKEKSTTKSIWGW